MAKLPVTDWTPPDDPIFGLTTAFRNDTRKDKVNLGVGAYRTADGEPLVLSSVRAAEQLLIEKKLNKEYLPIDGDADFVRAASKLIFGPLAAQLPLFGAQMVGGTGALRIGADYLALGGSRTIYLSNPTWANHKAIFSRAGLQVESYPYYDIGKGGLDFGSMCQAFEQMPEGAVVLLHGCCHNPTGVDLTLDQWRIVSDLVKKHRLLPFFDLAYQGLGEGLDGDAAAVRYFAEQGHELLVSYSFAKNFGLYNERVGFLAFVTSTVEAAQLLGRQLKVLIRGVYSNPPSHGARIVTTILGSDQLKADWMRELESMRSRVVDMRKALAAGLQSRYPGRDYRALIEQKGLFSFGFLTPDEVQRLRREFAIYCPNDGRINVAGLNPHNIDYVIDAIESVSTSGQVPQ